MSAIATTPIAISADALIEIMSTTSNPEPQATVHRQLMIAEQKNVSSLAAAVVLTPPGASPLLDVAATNPAAVSVHPQLAVPVRTSHVLGNLTGNPTGNPTAMLATGSISNRGVPLVRIATPTANNATPFKRRNLCPHTRRRRLCKDCGGSAYCEHGRQKHRCKDCGRFCQHGRNKYCCKDCGGVSFCIHKRRKQYCKQCGGGGNGLCRHNKRKSRCKLCGGSAYCRHNKRKDGCVFCNPRAFCVHQRLRRRCKACGGASQCWHGRYKHLCKHCSAGPKKRGAPKGSSKTSKRAKTGSFKQNALIAATGLALAGAKTVAAVVVARTPVALIVPGLASATGPAALVSRLASTTALAPPQLLAPIAATPMPAIARISKVCLLLEQVILALNCVTTQSTTPTGAAPVPHTK